MPDDKGADAKALGLRAFYTASGLFYGLLAIGAIRLLLGSEAGTGEESYADWSAKLMEKPFGIWLIGTLGVFVIGVGVYQAYRAYTAKFRKRLQTGQMTNLEDRWATRIGRIGFAARAVVFSMIGAFLFMAAVRADPNQARGLGGALKTLDRQPSGPWLLGLVGVGLAAYGTFQLVMARYRRIQID
jgi:hypothetical protein